MEVLLDTPRGFSFRRTVLSHGWCTLDPFRIGGTADALETTVALPAGGAARMRLRDAGKGVVLEFPGRQPGRTSRCYLVAAARKILGLDLDLDAFHRAVRREKGLRWIADTGTGRLLRCPTLFEDVVKLVLTTNCSWALTTRMVRGLVDRYGEPARDGSRAFPTPRVLAAAGAGDLRRSASLGYRAPYVAEIARRVACASCDLGDWEVEERPASELRREMMELPGVGPYVAENLLKLLGRPDGLALDSWMRSKFARVHHGGRRVTDRTIRRRYARLGRWAGLAVWFDLTRDWFRGDEPSAAWETLS